MKILFLDLDGVLNGFLRWPANAGRRWLDPEAIERLNRVIKETGAAIVVTSNWRRYVDVAPILRNSGVIAEIVGTTPGLFYSSRGDEIAAWLKSHPEVTRFAILDDDPNMGSLQSSAVFTDWAEGFQDHEVPLLIKKLGGYAA